MFEKNERCPECKVEIGQIHVTGCDTEQCPDCGAQKISCSCADPRKFPPIPWSGFSAGVVECREFGWYASRKTGWQECDANDPDAFENLNKLCVDAVWNAEAARYVKR